MEEGEEGGGWNNLVRVLPGGALHEIYGEFAGLVVDGYPIVSATGDSIEQQHLACLWAAEHESGEWRVESGEWRERECGHKAIRRPEPRVI